MRLIDADELKERFSWSEKCRLSLTEIKQIINIAPTAGAYKEGEWRNIDDLHVQCPFCNRVEYIISDYCRECGARLYKWEEDET